jgi:hypothetical protein
MKTRSSLLQCKSYTPPSVRGKKSGSLLQYIEDTTENKGPSRLWNNIPTTPPKPVDLNFQEFRHNTKQVSLYLIKIYN